MSSHEKVAGLATAALAEVQPVFAALEATARDNTARVLDAFRRHQVADFHFRTTTGYGYGDAGRDKLEEVWAEVCSAERALVRSHFVSGTHALAAVLFGILRPGDELLAVTGSPYDTMQSVIGYPKPLPGSLADFGISYREISLKGDEVDAEALAGVVTARTKMALIQRSRGYSLRPPLSVAAIGRACDQIRRLNPQCVCFVDNCYGEFVEACEPTAVGADIMAGSLIKNPGGGIAPAGGYIAGRAALVEQAACRLTAPGIGSELGASLADNRLLFQGLFLAPHVVGQALKGAIFAAKLFADLGYQTWPHFAQPRSDIIQAIELGSAAKMVAFCRGLQRWSPVDAHVRPEPSALPGYSDQVVMAGGTFVQGSSIELSADGPLRPPFAVYLQGGLTFEHAVLGILGAANEVADA